MQHMAAQRYIGYGKAEEVVVVVVQNLERLRAAGVLKNLKRREKREVYTPAGNVTQEERDGRVEEAAAAVSAALGSSPGSLLESFRRAHRDAAAPALGALSSALADRSERSDLVVEVWEADPNALKFSSFRSEVLTAQPAASIPRLARCISTWLATTRIWPKLASISGFGVKRSSITPRVFCSRA
jgi:hypothetical protein